jgi:hypothetical protein
VGNRPQSTWKGERSDQELEELPFEAASVDGIGLPRPIMSERTLFSQVQLTTTKVQLFVAGTTFQKLAVEMVIDEFSIPLGGNEVGVVQHSQVMRSICHIQVEQQSNV